MEELEEMVSKALKTAENSFWAKLVLNCWKRKQLPSLKLTASLPLEMDGWNTTFLLGRPIFRCELLVSGRVYIHHQFDWAIAGIMQHL